ncbi:hypothetical protein HPP92_026781 [Vanilla planifolia]|uniref:Uncharacterized protein n=1 Tax=Vanilla planifolia TaxID=51239 RepID=A0A835PCZ1_VANPL|nr:hypothetical protein HPP92_026781 [Vanilla planifolia]
MRATVSTNRNILDPSAAADLRKSSVPLEIDMKAKARIKIGKLKNQGPMWRDRDDPSQGENVACYAHP